MLEPHKFFFTCSPLPLCPFHLFLSALLLPTGLARGVKHLLKCGGSCFLFLLWFLKPRNLQGHRSLHVPSLWQELFTAETQRKLYLRQGTCGPSFLNSTFSQKQIVKSPPKLNIPKSFNNQYHWQLNRPSLCSSYKMSALQYFGLPLFL